MGMAAAPSLGYSQSANQVPADNESRVPVINLKDGTRLAGDDAPRRKDLEQWLKEHPGFVADTGAFIPVSPRLSIVTKVPVVLQEKLPKKTVLGLERKDIYACRCLTQPERGWQINSPPAAQSES